jgi:hypothetical protein
MLSRRLLSALAVCLPIACQQVDGAAPAPVTQPPMSSTTQIVRAADAPGHAAATGATEAPVSGDGGASTPPAPSCDELEVTLAKQVASAYEQGDLRCARAEDCVFSSAIGCYYGCSSWLIGREGQEATRAAVEQSIAPVCESLRACRRGAPSCPYQFPPSPECVEGRCQLFDDSPFSCGELGALAVAAYEAVRDEGDRSCAVDTDCSLFHEGPTCGLGCDLLSSVASRALGGLSVSAGRAGSKYCNAFAARGCAPLPEQDCLLPEGEPRPRCIAGLCELEYSLD